jgi:hypothetical protein
VSEIEFDEAAQELGDFMADRPQGQQAQPEPDQPVFQEEQEAQAPAPEEPAQQEPLRDPETGQFTTPAKLYAGRFQTPEELEQDYHARLGSMTNELGELRAYRDQMNAWIASQQQQPQGPLAYDEETLDRFDEYAIENPLQAAEQARQASDPVLYERAMDNWYATDPKAATRYEIAIGAGQVRHELAERYEKAYEPLQQQHNQQNTNAAFLNVARANPDIFQYGEQMVKAAEQFPDLGQGLQDPDIQVKERALQALYFVARGMGQAAPQAAPAAQAAPALPAGLAAHVASPTSIPPAGNLTAKQQVAAELDALWEQGAENG